MNDRSLGGGVRSDMHSHYRYATTTCQLLALRLLLKADRHFGGGGILAPPEASSWSLDRIQDFFETESNHPACQAHVAQLDHVAQLGSCPKLVPHFLAQELRVAEQAVCVVAASEIIQTHRTAWFYIA